MNDFKEMLKEAFVGEEPYDPAPSRAVLEDSLRHFESRDRMTRILMWVAVSFMSLLVGWSVWSFVRAGEDAGVRELLLYSTAFLFGCQGIAWSKMLLFTSQLDFRILKELKRVQLSLLGDASKS